MANRKTSKRKGQFPFRYLSAYLGALTLLACTEKATDTAETTEIPRINASSSKTSPSAMVSSRNQNALPETQLPAPPATTSMNHGGEVWSSCHHGFQTSNQPQKDITRLSFLCAPYQGMRRLGPAFFSNLIEGQEVSFERLLQASQVARVFVVSSDDINSFVVHVIDPSGKEIARSHSNAKFAIVHANGAFDIEDTGQHRIRIVGGQGKGTVAAEVWTLPPEKPN